MENKTIEKGKKFVMGTYSPIPVVLASGDGVYLTDDQGNSYLDMVAGIAVNSLGYNHPKVIQAINEQSQQLMHCSNLYWNEPQVVLAEKLCITSGLDKAFFCNSGAEANEAAIKLARKYGKKKKTIITMKQSFHGRTMGALKATGQTKYQNGFEPLPEGFIYTEANNIKMLESLISEDVCAIMLEVIQGEAGVQPLEEDYLQYVNKVCHENNILFIIDEVQTGMGRTGYPFAFQKYNLSPDIITLAKAISGGIPMGAMLAKDHVANAFVPGDHASTFGGNPLAAHVAKTVAEVIFDDSFLKNVQENGTYFKAQLMKFMTNENVVEVRGDGLMLGLVMAENVKVSDIVKACKNNGLLVCTASSNVIRFVPPLIINKEEIDKTIHILEKVLIL